MSSSIQVKSSIMSYLDCCSSLHAGYPHLLLPLPGQSEWVFG
jgi:hypothetical protein